MKKEEIDYPQEYKSPGVFIDSITFNDGTVLPLNHDSIIVFTGANNSGKSQVLKDIESCFNDSQKKLSVIVKNLNYSLCGKIDAPFLYENFSVNQSGYLEIPGTGGSYSEQSIKHEWEQGRIPQSIRPFFIKRISTDMRLTFSNSLTRDVYNAAGHPIYRMMKSDRLAETISSFFKQAFHEDLVVNRNMLSTIPLHVGKAPNKGQFTLNELDEYNSIIDSLPKLQDQGDGMRSFASILLDAFTSGSSVSLIDEPEAFLHPPQARILGKMLAQNNPDNRQLVVSTHSEDFLQGILDSSNENVTIVRIDRQDNINKMSVLNNEEIEKLWTNPLLRYSNILSGLFHEMVIVCESEYDCLFYQAIMNALYEGTGEIAPDILFTHCGGKSRMKYIVRALKAVNVPVVAICDFDLVNSSQYFRPLVESFGEDWDTLYSAGMRVVYDSVNAKSSSGVDEWARLKNVGKAGFDRGAFAAYEKAESICKDIGLFVVPYGEMEDFDKSVNKDKKDWVYHVLENYDLATDLRLNAARSFVQEVLDYGLST